MGIEDRDYYRDWWRKKQGFQKRAPFHVPLSGSPKNAVPPNNTASDPGDDLYAYGHPVSAPRQPPEMHWVLETIPLVDRFGNVESGAPRTKP